jgi:hypothetical protein
VKSIIAVVFAVTLGWVTAADASGPRHTVKGHHFRGHHHRGFIVQDHGLQVFGERRTTIVQQQNPCLNSVGQWQCGGAPPPRRDHHHHHHRPILVPVVPSQSCYVPGYWTTQWVPQTTLYTVWVDGYRAEDGTWITGHFEQRPYVSGYVQQQLWVPERWGC